MMEQFALLFSNKILVSALIGWASAQIIKTIIDFIMTKEFSAERLCGSGGMPSSHSSTVCAVATSTGILYGVDSPYFALAFVFAIIVMYDARGVRRETGNQAEILNSIMEVFKIESPDKFVFPEKELKELIGHTPFQVFMGAILGIIIGYVYCLYF